MKKLRTTNKVLIMISNIIELFMINYFMNYRFQYNLSSNLEGFLRVNLVIILLDIIYFFLLFFLLDRNKPYHPLKSYLREGNFLSTITFFPYHILKVMVLFYIFPRSVFLYSYYYQPILLLEVVPLIIFYILYLLAPRRDNIYHKCRMMKQALRIHYIGTYNIIYVHGDFSTFDVDQVSSYKIHKKNIYINDYDIECFKKYGYDVDKFMKKCVTCEITYLKVDDSNAIKKVLENTDLEEFKKIYIFVVNNKDALLDKEIQAYNAIQLVNKGEEIEFVENLLLDEIYASVSTEELRSEIRKIVKYNNNLAKKLYKNTSITCVPNGKGLFHFYKTAYYKESPYQSIVALLNYSACLLRMVSTYYYCKKNHITFDSEVDSNLVTDQYTVLFDYLEKNIREDDYLYSSIKDSKYDFTNSDKHLFKQELKYLLDSKIVGEYLDFCGLIEIFRLLRNKVEAHGSMTDQNIYMVWHVVAVLVDALNYFLKVDKIKLEVKKYEVIMTYNDSIENKNSLGKFIINYDNMFCFLATVHKLRKEASSSDMYINFLTGDASIKIKDRNNF